MRRRPLGSIGPDSFEEILPDDALVGEVVVQFANLSHVKCVCTRRGRGDEKRTRRRERMSSRSR